MNPDEKNESDVCSRCGNPAQFSFGGVSLCGECCDIYGSCCMEFGSDDLWTEALKETEPVEPEEV